MDARQERGMVIAATTALQRTSQGWIVPSQSGRGSYEVTSDHPKIATMDILGGLACTCPDFELRAQPCKHIIAVEITVKREQAPDGTVTETATVRKTYSQNWPAYNAAQTCEKQMFHTLLADICATIPQPEQKKGRPRLPRSDMAFAAVSRTYSGLSARRSATDVRDNKADGLTETDPHFNSVLRYLRDPEMTPVLKALVTLSALPLKGVESDFAIDSSGFSTTRHVRWFDAKWGEDRSIRTWAKLHLTTGVKTNIVTAAEVTDWRGADSPQFRPLVAATAEHFGIREMSADKAYSSKANLQAVDDLGGTAFVPFKATAEGPVPSIHAPEVQTLPGTASAWMRMYHQFVYQRDTFLAHYHKRSNVETTFHMIKAKFGASIRSKSQVGQINEVLAKVVAHNLCVLVSAVHELGLDVPQFSQVAALVGC